MTFKRILMKKYLIMLFLVLSPFLCADKSSISNKLIFAGMDAIKNGDKENAVMLFKKSCSQEDASGCALVGAMYTDVEKALEISPIKAYPYFLKACELKNDIGCIQVAYALHNGDGVKEDKFEAFHYAKKACNLGNGTGCYLVGRSYFLGDLVRQDFSKSKEYLGKACDLKNVDGCKYYTNLNEAGVK